MSNNERTSLAHFLKPPTRPVKEILEEISKNKPSYISLFIKGDIIPWINSDALANKEQEKVIRYVAWPRLVGDQILLDLTILKLNSLRG